MKRSIALVLLYSTGWLLTSAPCPGADNEFTRPSLKNIQELAVLIETVRPEIEAQGLTKNAIRSTVVGALQSAGLTVLPSAEVLRAPDKPYLYVNVNVFQQNAFVYSITVEFHQAVRLARNPAILSDAATWSKRYIGVSGSLDEIHSHTRDLVRIFLNAHGAANKPPG